jgi:hypothetical protein
MPIAAAEPRVERAPASRRWIALLIVSALLQVVTIGWVGGVAGVPARLNQDPPVITAQLQSLPPASEPAVAATAPPPKPLRQRKPRPRPPAPPVADIVPAPAVIAAADPASPPAPDHIEMPGPAAEPGTMADAALSDTAAIAMAVGPDPAHYKVSLPPSVELKYDVEALRNGQMTYGSGKIRWQSDGGSYTVNGEASILIFTLLTFKSAGVIDDFGIAPVIYAEKRFRRSETNTHFHRERNTISFSASTASYPRQGGEQDRASIIWQLTGIGRGDAERFFPGAEIDLFVAGVRNAETWRIRVVGQEDIEVGTGKTSTWHVVRIPQAGSREQQLDIWLAPQQEWYPVKLRYTETNGDYLDLSLSGVNLASAN